MKRALLDLTTPAGLGDDVYFISCPDCGDVQKWNVSGCGLAHVAERTKEEPCFCEGKERTG